MSLTKSLAWMGWSQGVTAAINFITTIVLARFLTPYDTGIYGLALATVGVLAIVQSLGLQAMVVREEFADDAFRSSAFTANAVITLSLSLMILIASYVGGRVMHEPGVERVMLVLSVTPLFGIINFLPVAMLERNGDFKSIAISSLVYSTMTSVATIILAIYGFRYMSIAWAQWIGSIASVTTTNYLGRQHISYRIGLSSWRRVARFGLQMVAVTGITQTSQRLSEMSLGRLLGLAPLGLFNRAVGINSIIWSNVHLTVGRVLFVDFAKSYRAQQSLRERYLEATAMLTGILWPAFIGLAIIGKPLIFHVYGPKWVECYSVLILISISSVGLVSSTMAWELFAATGNLQKQTRVEFIRAGVGLVLFCLGCMISLNAAASARVIDAIFAFVIYRPYINKMTDTRPIDFVGIYSRSAALTLAATLPSSVLMIAYGFKANVPAGYLFLSVFVGLVGWLIVAMGINHPLGKVASRMIRGQALLS